MCEKDVNIYDSTIQFVPDCYKTQKICDKVICEDPFMLVKDPDRYKTQGTCDKVVHDCLAALRFIPDSFVTSTMLF